MDSGVYGAVLTPSWHVVAGRDRGEPHALRMNGLIPLGGALAIAAFPLRRVFEPFEEVDDEEGGEVTPLADG